MSWSLSRTGTKDDVAQKVAVDFDNCAKNYIGTLEADDVLAVKARALALVGQMTRFEPDTFAPKGYNVRCRANGSHSTHTSQLQGASFSLTVDRVPIE